MILYLPPIAVKTVSKDGVCLNGQVYAHPALNQHIGEDVMLFQDSRTHSINICIGSELICLATVTAAIRTQVEQEVTC